MIGIISIVAGLGIFASGNILASLIFLFLGMFIFITKYGIEIDLHTKKYLDYLSLFGYKKGKVQKFDSIESVYLTSNKKSTRMQLRAARNTITKVVYSGYIKFSEEEKIHLMDSEKKAEVEKLLNQMSKDLSVECFDYSKEV
jgi:hypothetical protein